MATSGGRPGYAFTANNPYLTHPDPLTEGRDLFRRGVLSEAALALEAAAARAGDTGAASCEAWRLLGTVHAENDDDRQAIAAMARALAAEPSNLEVLLSLGVSHTNELAEAEAVGHLRAWLMQHPRYGPAYLGQGTSAAALPPTAPVAASTSALVAAVTVAAAAHPGDADLHTVLGVLFNLCRDYDGAVDAFRVALALRPDDYSLWNKLGATQANSARSAEALGAYRRALDLKPNYVRAWSNLGIGCANQGQYDQAARFYARALALNPDAGSVWGYLRVALACAGRIDLVGAVDGRDLETLQAALPL